mmetsp:Transcript_6551/g.19349  ORF Transcript_6551/g.19349 Transcript_6551/m.19349 type:complete len:265 (+) Transcript_6551:127-921(+)
MVDEKDALRKYLPLGAFSGLAATSACMSDRRFACNFSSPNDNFPKGTCSTPRLGSVRSATGPRAAAATRAPSSSAPAATVPWFLGAGKRPRGPSTRAALRLSAGTMAAVATQASKGTWPSATFSTNSSPPTTSAPASVAAACSSGSCAKAATTGDRPTPCGRSTKDRTCCKGFFGSNESTTSRPTDSSKRRFFLAPASRTWRSAAGAASVGFEAGLVLSPRVAGRSRLVRRSMLAALSQRLLRLLRPSLARASTDGPGSPTARV